MANYQVTNKGTRDFTLLAHDEVRGTLHYTEWFSLKAVLTLPDGANFRIGPKGVWGTTVELTDQQEKVLLNFKMNWSGTIIIKSKLNSRVFLFKQKSLLKNTFVLLDKDEKELMVVSPSFQWNSLKPSYSLSATEEFETLDEKDVLLLTTIHCANYYMSMMAASVAIAT
ncbi:hypothetical protein GCM10027346_30820 [Hymenobacter seoulensis]